MIDNSYKYWMWLSYPEKNKVLKPSKLYIEVYKGFVNLHQRKYLYQNSDVDIEIERPKYGVYIWPSYPYITT